MNGMASVSYSESVAMEMSLQNAFEVAIIDGINAYVRGVLRQRGFLVSDKVDDIDRGECLEEKYKIARELASGFAALPQRRMPLS
jgi:hypothetical protein